LLSVLSKPSPVDPNERNGLMMPTLQFAPVMNLRGTLMPSFDNPD
jgi:hypothetical protein